MWIWKQSSGELWRDEKLVEKGYAGAPGHVNKTESEGLRNRGPIPRGRYRIVAIHGKHKKGANSMSLAPVGHNALGRDGFMIHADSIARPGSASEGCIILPPATRRMIADSGDRDLEVTGE